MSRYEDRLRKMASAVLVELSGIDPYGLVRRGDGESSDEYDLEAKPIARLLLINEQVTVGNVDGVWTSMFGETLTSRIGTADMNALVIRLNGLSE